MKRLLILALAASLSACVSMPVYRTALDRAYADYQTAKVIADVYFPFASPARQAQITKGEQVAEAAFAAARLAIARGDQAAASAQIDKAQAATAVIDPPSSSAAASPPAS